VSAALCLAGKWPERRRLYQLNAVGVLIYLTDSISKKTFLVDTGAAILSGHICHTAQILKYAVEFKTKFENI
jgi:hypothetical protein